MIGQKRKKMDDIGDSTPAQALQQSQKGGNQRNSTQNEDSDEESRTRSITAKKPKKSGLIAVFKDKAKATTTAKSTIREQGAEPPASPVRLSEVRPPYAIPRELLPTSERNTPSDGSEVLNTRESSPVEQAIKAADETPEKKKRKKKKKKKPQDNQPNSGISSSLRPEDRLFGNSILD